MITLLWLPFAATLLKPFSPGQLVETVKEVLHAADWTNFSPAARFPVLAAAFRHRWAYPIGTSMTDEPSSGDSGLASTPGS